VTDHQPGDIANGHILTAAGWLPLRRLPLGSPGPYYAGDLLDSNAYTGSEWVYVPVEEAAKVPRADGTAPIAGVPNPAPRRSRSCLVPLAIGAAVLVVLAIIGGVIGASDSNDTSATTQPTPTPTTKAKPTKRKSPKPSPSTDPLAQADKEAIRNGYAKVGEGLYARVGNADTNEFTTTWPVTIATALGCSNGLYVQGAITDPSGAVVASTNGTLLSLPAGKVGIVKLTTMSSDQRLTVTIDKVNCY